MSVGDGLPGEGAELDRPMPETVEEAMLAGPAAARFIVAVTIGVAILVTATQTASWAATMIVAGLLIGGALVIRLLL